MKLKLTALDGSRVRRVGVAWFGSSRTADAGESGLVVLTNQGDLNVVSLPSVKMQVQHPCIRREDVSGIASCVFTKHGQGETQDAHTPILYCCRVEGHVHPKPQPPHHNHNRVHSVEGWSVRGSHVSHVCEHLLLITKSCLGKFCVQ